MADLVRRQVAVIATPGRSLCCARGQSCDCDNPNRLRRRRKSGERWSCRLPRSAGRQCDGNQIFSSVKLWPSDWGFCMSWCPKPFAWGYGQSGKRSDGRGHLTRHTRSCAYFGPASSGTRGQHRPGNRCGFSAMGRHRAEPLHRPRLFFVSRRVQFATLAARDRRPTSCANRQMPKPAF